MNLHEAYEYGKDTLLSVGIDDAATDAWYLLEAATGVSRQKYFLNPQTEIGREQEECYLLSIEKRAIRIPLQHITGKQEFMGFSFRVNEHVLIPRQDTESLVESVLDVLRPGMEILDMCTGSGCILISLLKLTEGISGTGVDISKEALEVAKTNAENLNVDARFVQSDLFENIAGSYDVIISNPPYIRTEVIKELQDEVRLYDPFIALDGKEDGLYFYRKIITDCRDFLKPGGKVYFEIGHDQGDDVKALMAEAGFTGVTVKKDLAGLDRVVFGVYNISEGIRE